MFKITTTPTTALHHAMSLHPSSSTSFQVDITTVASPKSRCHNCESSTENAADLLSCSPGSPRSRHQPQPPTVVPERGGFSDLGCYQISGQSAGIRSKAYRFCSCSCRKKQCSIMKYSSNNIARPFKTYVEIGRVTLVNYDKDYGRLVVIVDVIDQNRALVDAPDMVRSQMNFKRLSLTDNKRVPKKKSLITAMEVVDVKNKWEKSSWGRKLIVQKRRASLNDFDRFKFMLAKIKVLAKSSKMIPVMLMDSLLYGIRCTFLEYVCILLVAGGVSTFALSKLKDY